MSTAKHCRLKQPTPCIQYRESEKQALIDFILANGGTAPDFKEKGKAMVPTKVKEDTRFCYVMPGSWLRCMGPGQFSAVASWQFNELYELV